jgi:signal transduction histidine kinase
MGCVESPPLAIDEEKRVKLMTFSERFCVTSIRDQGPGVPDEEKEKIFERFYMLADGRKNPGQSTGLGLTISRRIAEAHSGVLWVEDNPGGGSVFSFLLPHPGLSQSPL